MKKENDVLNTVNQVIADSREREENKRHFTSMTMSQIVNKLVSVVRETLNELIDMKDEDTLYDVFMKEQRPIYIGIFMVIVSLFMIASSL